MKTPKLEFIKDDPSRNIHGEFKGYIAGEPQTTLFLISPNRIGRGFDVRGAFIPDDVEPLNVADMAQAQGACQLALNRWLEARTGPIVGPSFGQTTGFFDREGRNIKVGDAVVLCSPDESVTQRCVVVEDRGVYELLALDTTDRLPLTSLQVGKTMNLRGVEVLKTVVESTRQEPLFFLINRERGHVGNAVLFWAKGGQGYTTDVDNAQPFSKAEAMEILSKPQTDETRPKFEKIPVETAKAKARRVLEEH